MVGTCLMFLDAEVSLFVLVLVLVIRHHEARYKGKCWYLGCVTPTG